MDLTVVAIPWFFGSMGAEHLYLKKQVAQGRAPIAGDYERRDTIASLTMGTASLVAPLVWGKVLRPVTPGVGRYGKVLVAGALGAAAVATVADVLARKGDAPLPPAGVVPRTLLPPVDDPEATGPVTEPTPTAVEAVDGNRSSRRRMAKLARQVASSSAASAMVAGGVAAATTWAARTTAGKLFEKRVVKDLGKGPLAVAGAILAWDFLYYWNHRMAHESRYLWAVHVVHHSSEHYNLSTALRQPVADAFTASMPFTVLALLGFRPEVIQTARDVNLLYQFWVHTEAIRSLGAAEQIMNSPSLHRVHHGSNQQYLDRNHAGIFIIWDRLFGTHELEDEPVRYGLTRNIDSFNPVRIATHEFSDMVGDVRSATTWSERLSFVFRGPGWAYARNARKGEPVALAGLG
ncbi:hypothetical protein BH10ACT1_BH10ACT1_12080 [soil metagenome]